MEITDREMRSLVEMEMADLSVFSLCANPGFSKLFCPQERLKARYRFYYVSPGERDIEKTRRDIFNKTQKIVSDFDREIRKLLENNNEDTNA